MHLVVFWCMIMVWIGIREYVSKTWKHIRVVPTYYSQGLWYGP